ncbi:MAG: hypothetical protein H8E35_12135, partial [Ardenticatenia bacterium]|nr:hypothetical protein [Ardenticatenia bacterium]
RKENQMVAERGLDLVVDDAAQAWLLKQNEHPEWGARPLRRILQKHIREPLADWLLAEDPPAGSTVLVEASDKGLEFHKEETKTSCHL